MTSDLAAFHREQERASSCVAACVRIVKAWQGDDTDEQKLAVDWGEPPFNLKFHAAGSVGRYMLLDPDDESHVEYVRQRLRERWLIVTMFPGPLTMISERRRPPPQSRYGRLLPFEGELWNARGLSHAVVLVDTVAPEGVRYLDPYYPVDGQPFTLTGDEFATAWTGEIVIADPSPACPLRP